MNGIVENLWLVPALPIAAAGVTALLKQRNRALAAGLAIGAMVAAFGLSAVAFVHAVVNTHAGAAKEVVNVAWFQMGGEWMRLGWMLDPLTAVMLVMITFVGSLIFIYSTGYMKHEVNFTRFFCFLSLFAGAMLGLVIANSLLLLFMCWEVVGLTSYLLIGFWYEKPSAAAAAKKAFVVTRIGDLAFFVGMIWLFAQTGTLLFYDGGAGCLEPAAIAHMTAGRTAIGMAVSTGIALLIFCGAAGKSGQVPLHVWLPDAMEGPTPVSALIHAATMVAAGVFLIARVYPLVSAHASGVSGAMPASPLQVITWVGAVTAIFGAVIAMAQTDIKRILAYSTVSQLGYMMVGLGVGGVAVGMFHLITHAFFKALLFLGAGSVIHGTNQQDIRRMGGLRKLMPVTFATYAVGMLALSGFPLLFSGFWSKDEILAAAHGWPASQVPFYLCALGALVTAFYMTRQMYYVFAGKLKRSEGHPHESGAAMTVPLVVLATMAVLLGVIGTPAWPWFQSFLDGNVAARNFAEFSSRGFVALLAASSLLVFAGIGAGWFFYGRVPIEDAEAHDALGRRQPHVFRVLTHAFYFDALYDATIVRLQVWWARASDWLDRRVWSGGVRLVASAATGFGRLDNFVDAHVVNAGFDESCMTISRGGQVLRLLQSGRVQQSLRLLGLGAIALLLFLFWSARG